jgi:hypothetical protein
MQLYNIALFSSIFAKRTEKSGENLNDLNLSGFKFYQINFSSSSLL